MSASSEPGVRLAVHAMATRFELVIRNMDPARARGAGEEALAEIVRIEEQLSWFRPQSVVSKINREAGVRPVRVHAPVFELLQSCRDLHERTNGAFDPTVSLDPDGMPLSQVAPGMGAVSLNPADRTVEFTKAGVALNLGGIGKGYALDEAARLLRDAGVESALLHGGTSSAIAIGQDEAGGWRLGVSDPHPDRTGELVAWTELADAAFSASGIYGRGRATSEGWLGHVIDPRTGRSVHHTELAAVVTDSSEGRLAAAEADALSTALLVAGKRTEALGETATLCFANQRITEVFGPWRTDAPKRDA